MSERIQPSSQGEAVPSHYSLEVSDAEQTGVRLFSLYSERSDVTAVFVEFNDEYDVHAAVPWAGARTSRSDDPHEQIYAEIKDVTHAEKIEMFFGYGHASIANMSPTMIHLNNIPMQEAYWIFNHLTLVGGQETSTRYVELSNPTVTELERLVDLSALPEAARDDFVRRWEALGEQAHAGFAKWFPRIRDDLLKLVRADNPDVKDSVMDKRALDAARAWLPFGGRTSVSLQFDVREAINLIAQLDQRDDFYGQELADHLRTLYKLKQYEGATDMQADLAGMMKYSEGSGTVLRNLDHLAHRLSEMEAFARLEEISLSRVQTDPEAVESSVEFSAQAEAEEAGSEVIAGYVLTLLPNLHYSEVLEFANNLDRAERVELLGIIFDGHTQHDLLRNAADVRGHMVEIDTALAYQRDFNRHRAMGRIALMLETDNYDAVIKSGFNRSHVLSRTESLRSHEAEWNRDMSQYYRALYDFYDEMKQYLGEDADYSFMYHVLPLAHQSKLNMSGPLMQWNYFTHLRIRPGGDYGYRDVTYDIAEVIKSRTGISSKRTDTAPDYNDSSELLDRT